MAALTPERHPEAADFDVREVESPTLADGEFLVHNAYLSADPAMRGWIADKSTYWPRIEVGDTMRAFAAGEVVESRNPAYVVGEYFGLLDLCRPKAGETVAVSTAAGGVGSAVGQIAKIKGCRTIGFAGGSEKVRQCVEDFGYDHAIDYKATKDLDQALAERCPDRIGARIAICGTASYASWDPWNEGPRPERHLLVKRAIMQGFLTTDFTASTHFSWIVSRDSRYG